MAVWQAAACAAQGSRLLRAKRGPQLANDARLPHAGRPDDRHELGPAGSASSLERSVQASELLLAADERRRTAGNAPGAHERESADEPAASHAAGDALRLDLLERAELEGPGRESHRSLADEDAAGICRLLESRGNVDRDPRRERAPFAGGADDDLAGVYPDTQVEPEAEHLPCAALHGKCRVQRSLDVVLERLGHPEDGHDRVACELLDCSPSEGDLVRHCVEEPREGSAHPLGILLGDELRRAREVGEHHGGELPLAALGLAVVPKRSAAHLPKDGPVWSIGQDVARRGR